MQSRRLVLKVTLKTGKAIHKYACADGSDENISFANSLISMYGKAGCLKEAVTLFEQMNVHSVVSWNALISVHADNHEAKQALELFWGMRREGYVPNARSFIPALKASIILSDVQRARALHCLASTLGCDSDNYVQNTLIDMYVKFRCLEKAFLAFDGMIGRDVVSWNTLILGYAENGRSELALQLFSKMETCGFVPDTISYMSALKACKHCIVGNGGDAAKAIHLAASRSGCDGDIFLKNTLIDTYSKCGCLNNAQHVFDSINCFVAAPWNALMLGYVESGNAEVALALFGKMKCKQDTRTFVAALKACESLAISEDGSGKKRMKERGKALHLMACCRGSDEDIYVANTLIDMYVKCADIINASAAFERIHKRTVVSWTALMLGHAEEGNGSAVFELFERMKREGCEPDTLTYVALLKACSLLGALQRGRSIHDEICVRGLQYDVVIGNTLVDFYAKCGSLSEAENVFNSHGRKNMVTWTTLMTGYSRQGDSYNVFHIFDKMLDAGVPPNSVTFLCLLTACSHLGLVDKGQHYFKIMTSNGIVPGLEHYTCMVDLLGRAKQMDSAMILLRNMPISPDTVTWLTMLGSCRKWKNTELGILVFESLSYLDLENTGGYALMANTYGCESQVVP